MTAVCLCCWHKTLTNALLYKTFCRGFCGDCKVAAFRLVFVCLSAGHTADVDDDRWGIMGLCMLLILSKDKREKSLV